MISTLGSKILTLKLFPDAKPFAKKITSEIKNSKMKIQAKINGNELRIDGKKRDDLQAAMKLIEDLQTGIPIQFINFRD